jgi:glycosyltransferase involved in cell wall biosynthesis
VVQRVLLGVAMKILYLASVRIPSEKASGLAIVRQCEGFVQNGHSVDLLVPRRVSSEISIKEAYGLEPNFEIYKFRSTPLFWLGKPGLALLYFYETLHVLWFYIKKRGEYDAIFSRDQYRIFPFLCLGLSKKCYIELHTVHKNFFTKIVARFSKKIIVISNGLRDYYEEYGKREDVLVEPSGVYLEQFANLPDQKNIRSKFLLPTDKIIFGYIGKLTTVGESKGVEEIIEAFGKLQKEQPNTFLFLAGVESRERKEVLKRFESAHIPRNNFELTALDQSLFAQYLSACDVLLMNYPNKEHYAKYMSPIKMFAYLAVGKPVVSSDLPTITEIEGVQGMLLAKPDSVEDYYTKLLSAVTHFDELTDVAKSNITLAKKYSWTERAKRILS